MSEVTLRTFNKADSIILYSILSENEWPFHAGTKITKERFSKNLGDGYYDGPEKKTFLIENGKQVLGFIRLFDLGKNFDDDDTPLFDIRIHEQFRRQGVGEKAVRLAVAYVFEHYTKKQRIEATTRIDNLAMRQVLHKCGFVKEAHYRESWPEPNGTLWDTVGYGLLRKDWETKSTTNLDWSA